MSTKSYGGSSGHSLAYMTSASAAFLLVGSAEATPTVTTVNLTVHTSEVFAIRMDSLGNVSNLFFPNYAAFTSFLSADSKDAVLGVFVTSSGSQVRAKGDYASILRSSDFATIVSTSNSVGAAGFTWFRSTMGIANATRVSTAWAGSGYFGFLLSPGGVGVYYGWISVSDIASGASSITIASYAWESTSDLPIHVSGASGGGSGGTGTGGGSPAGGTPEPAASGLGLLALGAAGIMRRRRQAAAKAE